VIGQAGLKTGTAVRIVDAAPPGAPVGAARTR
jgi:hypothetical protein